MALKIARHFTGQNADFMEFCGFKGFLGGFPAGKDGTIAGNGGIRAGNGQARAGKDGAWNRLFLLKTGFFWQKYAFLPDYALEELAYPAVAWESSVEAWRATTVAWESPAR